MNSGMNLKNLQLNPTVIYNPLDKVKLISLSKKKLICFLIILNQVLKY